MTGDELPFRAFGPDFPFDYVNWVAHPCGIARIPQQKYGSEVAIVGAGLSGVVAAYELMKLGFRPVVYEAEKMGGRLRSHRFCAAQEAVADLGGMRFPLSSGLLFHYLRLMKLKTKPFPNPLTPAAGSTVINLQGKSWYAKTLADLPPIFTDISTAWQHALEENAHFSKIQQAMRERNTALLKTLWNELVIKWSDKSFYNFLCESSAFSRLSFRHKEIFGQTGFGTGGWDSDFPNSILEILRVVLNNFDSDQQLIVGGADRLVEALWQHAPENCRYWPRGTSLASLHNSTPHSAVTRITRASDGTFAVTDKLNVVRRHEMVLITCQSSVFTTQIACQTSLFPPALWTAFKRTHYMQSCKTFVLVDRPFWKDKQPGTGHDLMSITLTDDLTRGTYLFDNGDDKPAVICFSYAWMGDAMKFLTQSTSQRVELALATLKKIYPDTDIASHIIGEPVTISWEAEPAFCGAFKGALPGHYRYNRRMYCHFMQQTLPLKQRGIFIAGDYVSWTPAWAEGAVQTALNAVWGIIHHVGGKTYPRNPGPGDRFEELAPLLLADE